MAVNFPVSTALAIPPQVLIFHTFIIILSQIFSNFHCDSFFDLRVILNPAA